MESIDLQTVPCILLLYRSQEIRSVELKSFVHKLKTFFNPYWQISGASHRPFYWKTHPSKNPEYLFSFLKKRVVT